MVKLHYYKGIIAEALCIVYLILRGHKIIGRRIKTPVGEIDVLTKRWRTLYTIEVKYRSSSIDDAKMALLKSRTRVKMAYKWWSKNHKYSQVASHKHVEFKYFVCSGWKIEVGSM